MLLDLRRPNVKFTSKTSKRDADEVATHETDVYKAIIALNNYRVIVRLHFPGRMDVEPFFAVWLRRILAPTGAVPTIKELEKAFQLHITNRATAAANGMMTNGTNGATTNGTNGLNGFSRPQTSTRRTSVVKPATNTG